MTKHVESLLKLPPFALTDAEKNMALLPAVQEAMRHHYDACHHFKTWCDKQRFDPMQPVDDLSRIPFLPVGVFKRLRLQSVGDDQVVRVLHSSATSTQVPSQIALDRVTRDRQMRVLASILTDLMGGSRRPFIVLDAAPNPATIPNAALSARIAGMRGYLMASSRTEYVVSYDGERPVLDIDRLSQLVEEFKATGQPFCLIGYTFMLYQHVVRVLQAHGKKLGVPESTLLIHFGGWKRLQDQQVSKPVLNRHTSQVFGLAESRIYDIYGFTEQLGVIYVDDADGIKRTPVYAEVLVRDPVTLELAPDGEEGLLEFVTPLPHSYPGVAILTDDIGRIVARGLSSTGQHGTGFEVRGRAQNAEVRGCGDTLPKHVYEVTS